MRLIDADALDTKLDALAKKYAEQKRFEVAKDYSFVQTVLLTAPTIDAVPVVRCGECKQWKRNVGVVDSPNGHCFYLDAEMNACDFCSYGERKDGED